jgi:hypothetical protein
MIRFLLTTLFTCLFFASAGCANEHEIIHDQYMTDGAGFSVLVFTKTEGFRHNSIEHGVEAVKTLGEENGFSVTRTENSDYFTVQNLGNYQAVIFLNTTQTVFDDDQRAAFRKLHSKWRWVMSGSTRQQTLNMTGPGTANWPVVISKAIRECRRQ